MYIGVDYYPEHWPKEMIEEDIRRTCVGKRSEDGGKWLLELFFSSTCDIDGKCFRGGELRIQGVDVAVLREHDEAVKV
ncbi:Beta-galactosidase [Anoxybacillus flavithermus]|uniref:hypothetical protein n=1 Tax=Anoxybacillus flavithermus TaxID=33934 RepID=UPI0007DA1B73|nr:hypothetical protein [Anoxybacillus flavithermus]OAO83795.1 Beta-galactosidase [Anoxybacillus flavithermus]